MTPMLYRRGIKLIRESAICIRSGYFLLNRKIQPQRFNLNMLIDILFLTNTELSFGTLNFKC